MPLSTLLQHLVMAFKKIYVKGTHPGDRLAPVGHLDRLLLRIFLRLGMKAFWWLYTFASQSYDKPNTVDAVYRCKPSRDNTHLAISHNADRQKADHELATKEPVSLDAP